jgi:hypothetical protein
MSLDELEMLIAKLSDGTLSPDESQRLNDLLKADAIAQESYLDHLAIDALLDREFHGTVATTAESAGNRLPGVVKQNSSEKTIKWALATCALTLAFGAVGGRFLWRNDFEKQPSQSLMVHLGFEPERDPVNGQLRMSEWQNKFGEVIDGFEGITAFEGRRMFRFRDSDEGPQQTYELVEVVDLNSLVQTNLNEGLELEATAFFNAIEPDSESFVFELSMLVYHEDGTLLQHTSSTDQQPVAISVSKVQADNDLRTWQRLKTRTALPAGSRRLVIRLSVSKEAEEQSGEIAGIFADDVSLRLVHAM